MTKLMRMTTVPVSLQSLLRGQMRYMKLQGFTVWMSSADGTMLRELEQQEGCPHYIVPMTRKLTPLQDLKALWVAYRLLRRLRPDIIHTHTPKAGLIGMLAGWFAGIPIRLHTVAGLPLMEREGFLKQVLIRIEQLTYACSTGIYPNSIALRNYIEKVLYANPQKLKVIGHGSSNGIDSRHFHRTVEMSVQGQAVRNQWNIQLKTFVWIYIGRIVRQKGVDELIQAYVRLANTCPDIRLVLVGPFESDLDPISPDSEQLLKNRGDIIITGFQADVRPYLAMADALVFPSYREGFPNVPMQAACMELPMIVTDINGCNEIVTREVNGLIVPPKDEESLYLAMKRLYEDTDLRQKFSRKSRELMVERFDQQWIWQQWLIEYKRLMVEKRLI
ncbi:glycosyltransferase family 4 protein [Larkinella sp. GY13]|uniref:glycosyltransferase family 4 protein n=1 Tax=Larkinella sp. GY13 TaxID=3453720 RepID=UPI003EED645A